MSEKLPENKLETVFTPEQLLSQVENAELPVISMEKRLKSPVIKERLIADYLEHWKTGGRFVDFDETEDKKLCCKEINSESELISFLETILENVFDRTGISYSSENIGTYGKAFDTPEFGFGDNDIVDESRKIKSYGGVYLPTPSDDDALSLKEQITKQRSFTEVHEKGHVIRMYLGHSKLIDKISESLADFDINTCLNDAQKKGIAGIWRKNEFGPSATAEEYPDNEMLQALIDYVLEPQEVLEKMSMLKSFFGFTSNEEFTNSHLEYAKSHFLQDSGYGENIFWIFFFKIMEESKGKGIALMNELGV